MKISKNKIKKIIKEIISETIYIDKEGRAGSGVKDKISSITAIKRELNNFRPDRELGDEMFSQGKEHKDQAIQLAVDAGLVGDLEGTMATRELSDVIPSEDPSAYFSPEFPSKLNIWVETYFGTHRPFWGDSQDDCNIESRYIAAVFSSYKKYEKLRFGNRVDAIEVSRAKKDLGKKYISLMKHIVDCIREKGLKCDFSSPKYWPTILHIDLPHNINKKLIDVLNKSREICEKMNHLKKIKYGSF